MEMSPELSRGIKRADSRVHTAIEAAKPEDVKANYLDISHVEGEISFLPTNRKTNSPYKAKNLRTSGKPLRILKKLVKSPVDPWVRFDDFDMSFDNVSNSSFLPAGERSNFMRALTDRDWENFLYALRPTIQEIPLELVDGDLIKKYYHEVNYSPDQTLTTLRKSCMRYESNQRSIGFYAKCPNVKLLVELDDNKKVRGRALIWTLTNGETYMDRVYGNEVTTQIFRQYAEKQGWFHRTHNTYTNLTSITTPQMKKITKSMAVEIEDPTDVLPWMDTFKFILTNGNHTVLSNDQNLPGYRRRR